MTATKIIHQCPQCHRYYVDGAVVQLTFGEQSAAMRNDQIMTDFICPESEHKNCVAKQNQEREAEHFRMQRRMGKVKNNAVKKHVNSDAARLPYKDNDSFTYSQSDFESSHAADTQNAKLIEFFSDPKTHGKMFPMPYLEEISGAKRMNNRAIDLRKHFKPLGFDILNEQRQINGSGPLHSHYGIFKIN
jgi:hypothetical protein